MCCCDFCVGMAMGIAAGTCIGIRMKSKERKIRRMVDKAFDSMSR